MVHVKTELAQFMTSRTDMTSPIILIGIKGEDYLLVKVKAATTNHVAIGDLFVWSDFPITVEYCADNANVAGIVPNTAFNLKALAVNNPGVALTKELYFDGTETFEVCIPYKSILVSSKVEISSAITAGEAVMAGATGAHIANDDSSPTCGVALYSNTSGSGTDAGAIILCPPFGMKDK